jgi:hypothetical protein
MDTQDDTKIYHKQSGWKGMDWLDLAQDRKRGAGFCESSYESLCVIKCKEFLELLEKLLTSHKRLCSKELVI